MWLQSLGGGEPPIIDIANFRKSLWNLWRNVKEKEKSVEDICAHREVFPKELRTGSKRGLGLHFDIKECWKVSI